MKIKIVNTEDKLYQYNCTEVHLTPTKWILRIQDDDPIILKQNYIKKIEIINEE